MPDQKLTDEILTAAIAGFEAQKEKIDMQIAELRQMLGGKSAPAPSGPVKGRRKMSAAGRKRIAAAQRLRWAATKAAQKPEKREAPKVKRRLSAAGRKRISEATKKRWAAVKAAKASTAKA